MTKGWFEAFRVDGGPTLYGEPNRTSVSGDASTIIIYILFCMLFLAFLIVFPGIRKERCTTFISVAFSLFVGAVILLAQHGTEWHVASGRISSSYRAFSAEKLLSDIGIKIGLNSVNITLKASPIHRESEGIDFNERFNWMGPTEIKEEFHKALVKGLPYPILTVAEYLSVDSEGFCWGRWYRRAGYYSHFLLWTAFASWVMTNIMMCVVPLYGAYMMQITGLLMLLTNAVYAFLLPEIPLVVKMEEGVLLGFGFGWCYYTVLAAGILSVLFGTIVAVLELVYPQTFSTIMQVDHDTPCSYCVPQKENLEESPGCKTPYRDGIDNKGFESTENPAIRTK